MTDPDALRAEITRLGPWHHDVEVAPGVRTGAPVPPGTYPSELGTPTVIHPDHYMGLIVGAVYPGGLAGRSVLDCACNAGGMLFAAGPLGAGRRFGFDVRDHWIDQARFLARHLPCDGLEFVTCDLAALPGLNLKPFDVTLFNGIFYHLPDPVHGLRIAADLTTELLVVNTAANDVDRGDALILNRESETAVMSGVHGLAWLPSGIGVLRDILRWCGFPHTRIRYDMRRGVWRRRIEILAARDDRVFAHYDATHPPEPSSSRPSRWIRRLLGRR